MHELFSQLKSQSDADYTTNFRTEGTNACYKGKTFTFADVDLKPTAFSGNELQTGFLDVFIKDNDDWTRYDVGPGSTIQGKKDGAELRPSSDDIMRLCPDCRFCIKIFETPDSYETYTSCWPSGEKLGDVIGS